MKNNQSLQSKPSRASKYIIPFSREEVKVGDRLIQRNGVIKATLDYVYEEKERKHLEDLIGYHKMYFDGYIVWYIDRTPSLWHRFMDWLES